MRNRELDCFNTGKIGFIHQMLPPGPRFGFLTQHIGERIGHGIKCGHRRQPEQPAPVFQLHPGIAVHQSEQHQPGIGRNIHQYPVEMAF